MIITQIPCINYNKNVKEMCGVVKSKMDTIDYFIFNVRGILKVVENKLEYIISDELEWLKGKKSTNPLMHSSDNLIDEKTFNPEYHMARFKRNHFYWKHALFFPGNDENEIKKQSWAFSDFTRFLKDNQDTLLNDAHVDTLKSFSLPKTMLVNSFLLRGENNNSLQEFFEDTHTLEKLVSFYNFKFILKSKDFLSTHFKRCQCRRTSADGEFFSYANTVLCRTHPIFKRPFSGMYSGFTEAVKKLVSSDADKKDRFVRLFESISIVYDDAPYPIVSLYFIRDIYGLVLKKNNRAEECSNNICPIEELYKLVYYTPEEEFGGVFKDHFIKSSYKYNRDVFEYLPDIVTLADNLEDFVYENKIKVLALVLRENRFLLKTSNNKSLEDSSVFSCFSLENNIPPNTEKNKNSKKSANAAPTAANNATAVTAKIIVNNVNYILKSDLAYLVRRGKLPPPYAAGEEEVTPIFRLPIIDLDDSECISFYNNVSKRAIVYTIDELTQSFMQYKTAVIFGKDSPIFLASHAVYSLSEIAQTNAFENLSEAIRLCIEYTEKYKQSIASIKEESSLANKAKIDGGEDDNPIIAFFKNLLDLGLLMRNGAVKSEDSVISDADFESRLSIRIHEKIMSFEDFFEKKITQIRVKRILYDLPLMKKFKNDSCEYFVPSIFFGDADSGGENIFERLEIVKQGDRNENINSCVRMSSNYFVATACYFLYILETETAERQVGLYNILKDLEEIL